MPHEAVRENSGVVCTFVMIVTCQPIRPQPLGSALDFAYLLDGRLRNTFRRIITREIFPVLIWCCILNQRTGELLRRNGYMLPARSGRIALFALRPQAWWHSANDTDGAEHPHAYPLCYLPSLYGFTAVYYAAQEHVRG